MTNNIDQIWLHFLEDVQLEVGELVFDVFFKDTKLHSLNDNCANIVCAELYTKQYLDNNLDLIQKVLHKICETNFTCRIYTQDSIHLINETSQEKIVEPVKNYRDNLNAEFIFDNFVTGECNKKGFAASLAVASNPGQIYNPLLLFGNSGLGKTHLLQAIGNFVKQNSTKRVLYVTSEMFFNDFMNVLKNKNSREKDDYFREKYRNIDVLLFDDIQFMSDKEKSNEKFFHVYNELFSNNKQIVITSDRHPNDLNGLEERLVSRFHQGLSIEIGNPEFTTSVNIIKRKLRASGFEMEQIDDDVIDYIATNHSQDVRRIEGAINQVMFHKINFNPGGCVTLHDALDAFNQTTTTLTNKDTIDAKKIKYIVADYYNLTVKQLESKSRTSSITVARHMGMYLCREMLEISFEKIGDSFGGKDHSTVMNAYKKVEKLLKTDPQYKRAISDLKKCLKK